MTALALRGAAQVLRMPPGAPYLRDAAALSLEPGDVTIADGRIVDGRPRPR